MKAFYVIVGVIIGLLVNLVLVPYIFDEYYKMKGFQKTNKYKPTSSKESIPITKGVCKIDQGKRVIDTYNRKDPMYTHLKPSVNRIGGSQFSYSFWLRRSQVSGLDKKILFFRGSQKKEIQDTYKRGVVYESHAGSPDKEAVRDDYDPTSPDEDDGSSSIYGDRFVKCPLVRFYKEGLQIEFNTLKDPHMFVRLNAEVFRLLKSSSSNPKYNMITVTFQDNFDFGGKERGIKVDVFIDDALVKTSTFEDNALKLNEGDIVLFPNTITSDDNIDADMVNLTYHNYALSIDDIEGLYNKGFAAVTCQLPDTWNPINTKHSLSKINLYNETQQIL